MLTQTALIVHCLTHKRGGELVQQVICEPVFSEADSAPTARILRLRGGQSLVFLAFQILGRGHEAFPCVCDPSLRCWIYWM